MASTAVRMDRQEAERVRRQPEMKVVRGGRYGVNKVRAHVRNTIRVVAAAVLLGLLVSIIQNKATLTQLSGDIDKQRTKLTAAQSTYDYLSSTISSIENYSDVQTYAEATLGLVQYDPSQVTYLQLEQGSVISSSSGNFFKLWNGFRSEALNLANNS